jgi:trans-4-hydroxy-L-proline dehydratase
MEIQQSRMQTLREHLRLAPAPVWAEPFHDAWQAGLGLDLPVRFAQAQAAEMAAARPFVKPGELIIGHNALRPIVSGLPTPYRSGIYVEWQLLQALKAERPGDAARLAAIEAYWTAWMAEHRAHLPMTCHAAPAYHLMLDLGVDGLRERVERWRAINTPARPESGPWYDALGIVLNGITAYIVAHAAAADRAAGVETEPVRKGELARIASACRHVAHAAPRSFFEAVQLFYLVFLVYGHDSPGPLDRMLYPFLRRDLDNSSIRREEAQEILDCLWLKFEEKEALGATLGGQLRDGSDAANELSLMCVSSIKRLRLLSPRTALRWHRGLSGELFDAAVDSIASGATYPSLVNDEAIIPAMVERGVALEDAREYTFVGCGQTYPHGRGHGNYEDVVINAARPLEFALNNGVDPVTGQRLGLATGEPAGFATFEQFERAYRAQMDHHITSHIRHVNEYRLNCVGQAYDLLRSLLIAHCVERGFDWHAGGAQYCEGMVDMVGMTTVTDSLVAIKQAVYEQKRITLPELVDALNCDWQGAETLRQMLLHKVPKFGNENEEADRMAAAEVARVNEHIKSHRTAFGGPWGMDIIGWSGAVEMGLQTGATPDGRRQGDPLADCAGPAQGRNTRGVTPTLLSVLKLPHAHVHGPLALSLRFTRSAVHGRAGRARLRALIEAYFRQGGQQLQISVASTEDMHAAQQDPDAYRDLMVRVGGFSAYFTQLDRKWQDDMIARSELGL